MQVINTISFILFMAYAIVCCILVLRALIYIVRPDIELHTTSVYKNALVLTAVFGVIYYTTLP